MAALDSYGIIGIVGWNNNRLGLTAAAQPTNLRPSTVHTRGTAVSLQLVEVGPGLVRLNQADDSSTSTKAALECNGSVVTFYKRESLVAASKGSFRAGQLRATQSKEDWVLWAKERREIVPILRKVL